MNFSFLIHVGVGATTREEANIPACPHRWSGLYLPLAVPVLLTIQECGDGLPRFLDIQDAAHVAER